MKSKLYKMLLILILMLQVWGIYLMYPSAGFVSSQLVVLGLFVTTGLTAGVFCMMFLLDKSSSSARMYKRELEKESISSTESASQIKVLESKIEVLEKALEQALNK